MIATLNEKLGRVTMYRVMTLTLSALAVVALICSALKVLDFSPAALAVSLVVLVIVSLAANKIFALLFSVVPHTESALITALILFFVLQPATDMITTLQIALGALFAMASKYLIAVRGRHLVNPAAAGAVWLAVFGMPLALWWVGTPVLLGFVAVGAAVIVARTRRFAVVGVFLLVAVVGLTVRSLSHQDLGAALGFALAQSPVIFLAGFMLTEPLTLPPAKWQQLLVAAVIGALVGRPLAVPELRGRPGDGDRGRQSDRLRVRAAAGGGVGADRSAGSGGRGDRVRVRAAAAGAVRGRPGGGAGCAARQAGQPRSAPGVQHRFRPGRRRPAHRHPAAGQAEHVQVGPGAGAGG